MTRTQHGQADCPAAFAAASPERVTTRPGCLAGPAAVIRPAHAADEAALGDFFAALSPHSRYLRFFGPVTPGPALLRRLCGGAEGVDAVVAVRGGLIIGHAMAADQAGPPGPSGPHGSRVTDIGLVVADAWQGRGVGAALMRALVTGAQARGLTSMTMDVLHGNQRVLAMILAHWPATRIDHSGDGLAIRIRLEDQHQHQHRYRYQQPSAATA
jgi:ribosomal protein S18 acetylase RimI-like enzyme